MFTNLFLLPLSYIAGKIMERKGNNMDTNLEESKILFTAGDGTAENPFIISDREGLEAVSDNLSAHYKLGADIDLLGEAFTPIGTLASPFAGSLDGDGHVLRGLKVSAAGYAGLFGCSNGATFRNIRIEEAEIESTSNYAGILIGDLNDGTILGCYVSGVATGKNHVGGLAGRLSGNIQESCVEGIIMGDSYVGGLTGQLTGSIVDSYVKGSVESTSNSIYTGGLAGYSQSAIIRNSYVSSKVSSNGQGLTYVHSSTTIQNSFFDRDIYAGWDMDTTWEYKQGVYPILRKIEFFGNQFFELQVAKVTWHSAIVRWDAVFGTTEYELHFKGEVRKLSVPEAFIKELAPDTEYDLKVVAKMDDLNQITSKTLKLKTKEVIAVKGIHSTNKEEDAITLVWNQIKDAEGYQVTWNENIIASDINTCTLTELSRNVPYVISIRALLKDGREIVSSPIVEKIYELEPQTDYAKEFITKCEGQTWFIDEIENLLNKKGKSICTVNSRDDFATIYVINLSDRGINGQIPSAIGELYQLRYLYLAHNDLGGQLPSEIINLEYLIDKDLSGNHFAE